MQQGIEQGIEQGAQQEKIDIAKSMLKDNVSLEMIEKYTGLSLEDIKKL